MVIEQGHGEIDVDGKITKVGPGSVMYTDARTSRTGSSTPATRRSSSTSSSGLARTASEPTDAAMADRASTAHRSRDQPRILSIRATTSFIAARSP